MSILLALILCVVLFMIFVSLLLFVIGPVLLLQPNRRTIEFYRKYTNILHPSDLHLEYEELWLKTAEGIDLSCWLIKAPRSKGTIIYLHGVSECKIVGLSLAKHLHDRGYNVFLYDQRRHGDSGGTFCTYGFYEKHDTSTIINYLESRDDLTVGRIGLFGASMGAAIAIQVASIDKRVAAVVAESGFATLRTIFDDYQKRMIKLPWHYLRNIVIKRSEHLAHFKANVVSPLDAVKNVHVPIFIIHGTADDLIKYTYSRQLYENTGDPKEPWLIEGAKHHNIAEVGGEEYKQRILDFFDRGLTNELQRQPITHLQ
ncbi:MAG: alpha/beta hydrolase [Ignavibacteriae bacterium]|nr:alpha/beta hydrolase [Ignavibacteriota bacterium]